MARMNKHYVIALSTAVLVTLLWSTSYILNKLAFQSNIGSFTLAGLRYAVSAVTLLLVRAVYMRPNIPKYVEDTSTAQSDKQHSGIKFAHILLLGVTGYLMAQGLQYAGQMLITPTQTSMVLAVGNTTALVVLDVLWLREIRGQFSFFGIAAGIVGVALFYYPWNFEVGSLNGVVLTLTSCIGYAVHLALSRYLLKTGKAKTGDLVFWPMIIGAVGMLVVGIIFEGMPSFSWSLVGIVLWLGTINGSLAFSLWTWSQKRLRAYESSMINNLMLLEVTILDVLIFNRSLSVVELLGVLLSGIAIVFVHVYPHIRNCRYSSSVQEGNGQQY